MEAKSQFKIIVVGDAGVGKTTFIKRHRTGEFEAKYVPTLGAEVHKMTYQTNLHSEVVLNLWDCSGSDQFSDMKKTFYAGADGAIVFFDVCQRTSYKNASLYIREIRENCGNIPIFLCGNKVDSVDRKVRPKDINLHRDMNLSAYYDISAKSNFNFEKPFIKMSSVLLGYDVQFL